MKIGKNSLYGGHSREILLEMLTDEGWTDESVLDKLRCLPAGGAKKAQPFLCTIPENMCTKFLNNLIKTRKTRLSSELVTNRPTNEKP